MYAFKILSELIQIQEEIVREKEKIDRQNKYRIMPRETKEKERQTQRENKRES